MANISFGQNILPKTDNTYSLGNSSYKWHAYLADINGQAIEDLVLPAVTSSDNDKILKVSSGAWTVGDAPSGLPTVSSTDNGKILSVSNGEWVAITPSYLTSHQDISGKANTADLATVATSGSYVDLLNKPDLSQYLTSVPTMTGATSSTAGATGLVPAPTTADSEKFLRGDGTWATPKVFIALYGTTTYSEISTARQNDCLVFCKVATDGGTSYRYAPLSFNYVVHEFHYYKPANPNEVDEMYIYKINSQSEWSTTVKQINIKNTLIYGTSTWSDLQSMRDHSINLGNAIFCKISIGNGNRFAVLNYLTGSQAEFFYYKISSSTNTVDSIFTYKLNSNDEWTETETETSINISIMTGATSSVAGTSGLVPAPATTDVDKFLAGDGTYKSGGLPMVILSYGSSTWQNFIDAYNNNVIVYCRASSNSNPASGSQTRMAFMAYVNNATTPTEVEFQYYRSMSSHSATAMGDQVFVYKLTKTGGWSVTTRDASIKQIKVDTNDPGTVSWSGNVVTLKSGLPKVTASDNGKILQVVNGAWAAVTPE